MYAQYLAMKHEAEVIQTASVNPGLVRSETFRTAKLNEKMIRDINQYSHFYILVNSLLRPFSGTPWHGTQTRLYIILVPKLNSGAYYDNCTETRALPLVCDKTAQEELIAASRKAIVPEEPLEGAQTTLYTALTPKLNSEANYADCAVTKTHPLVFDQKVQEEPIVASRKAVGLEQCTVTFFPVVPCL
ncbi:hypothetical protein Aperf_G00000008102 [Anoplocephala perfoliata]